MNIAYDVGNNITSDSVSVDPNILQKFPAIQPKIVLPSTAQPGEESLGEAVLSFIADNSL